MQMLLMVEWPCLGRILHLSRAMLECHLLGDKANKVKTEAENFADKAKDYFEELQTKGSAALKEHLGDVEKMMGDLFGKKDGTSSNSL